MSKDNTKIIENRCRAKFVGAAVIEALTLVGNPTTRKFYERARECATRLDMVAGKVTSKYCGFRGCIVCNRIRTMKLINGYGEALEGFTEPYFVTLTRPNIATNEISGVLRREIDNGYAKRLKKVKEVLRKRKIALKMIEKYEVTISKTGEYHPHIHLIVDGKEVAEMILSEWLKRNEGVSVEWAQDMRPATVGSLQELFKYFAKIIYKIDGQYTVHAEKLDYIWQEIRGFRLVRATGIKLMKEDIEEGDTDGFNELISQHYEKYSHIQNDIALWFGDNYYSKTSGEQITSFEPTRAMSELVEQIKQTNNEMKGSYQIMKPKDIQQLEGCCYSTARKRYHKYKNQNGFLTRDRYNEIVNGQHELKLQEVKK